MRKLLFIIVSIVTIYGSIQSCQLSIPEVSLLNSSTEEVLKDAFANKRSNIQVEGKGTVTKILADDLDGSKHQRFIVKLTSGKTLLITHNIDLAPRINSLQVGDSIVFKGEYEWNPEGGIIWTHHDPAGYHVGGWLKHDGKIYQ